MATAFRTYTPDGVLQLDSGSPGPAVIATGRGGAAENGNQISIPVQGSGAPLVLFRPDPGVALGGIIVRQGSFWYMSNGGFDWAVASATGPFIGSGATQPAFNVWTPDGRLVFSNRYRYPRIVQLLSMAAPVFGSGGPSTRYSIAGLSGWSVRPWLMTNALGMSLSRPMGGGSDVSYPTTVLSAMIPADRSYIRVEMRDSASFSDPYATSSNNYNPYQNKPMRFALCILPGL